MHPLAGRPLYPPRRGSLGPPAHLPMVGRRGVVGRPRPTETTRRRRRVGAAVGRRDGRRPPVLRRKFMNCSQSVKNWVNLLTWLLIAVVHSCAAANQAPAGWLTHNS